MAGDWLKLHRCIMDSEVMQDDWLCRLWMWCLVSANYRESVFMGQQLQPGQFITGRHRASAQLGVSPSKFYRGLARLQELGNIEISANSNWTTVTISNWQTYQGEDDTERTASEQQTNSKRTASEQQVNTEEEGKKERKKEVNTKKAADAVLIPAELNGQDFSNAWADLLTYRTERKLKTTPSTQRLLLKRMAGWGPQRAVAAIHHSIANGWQGVFEPNANDSGRGTNGRQLRFGGTEADDDRQRELDEAFRGPPAAS